METRDYIIYERDIELKLNQVYYEVLIVNVIWVGEFSAIRKAYPAIASLSSF